MIKTSMLPALRELGRARATALMCLSFAATISAWATFFLAASLLSPVSHQYPVKELFSLQIRAWLLLEIGLLSLIALSFGPKRTLSLLTAKDPQHGK